MGGRGREGFCSVSPIRIVQNTNLGWLVDMLQVPVILTATDTCHVPMSSVSISNWMS